MADDEKLPRDETNENDQGEKKAIGETGKDVGAGTPLQLGETYSPISAPQERRKPDSEAKPESAAAEPPQQAAQEPPTTAKPQEPQAAAHEAPPTEERREGESPSDAGEPPESGDERPPQPETIDYESSFKTLKAGDVVSGEVVHVDREGVLVDVGTKSEGLVPYAELARRREDRRKDAVSVGDKIDVYVLQADDDEQGLLLSKKRADFERAWEKILDAHENGSTLHAMVTDRVKGGLVVDLGLRGFVPASHSGVGRVHNLDKLVGQSIPLKVIEVDRDRRKVILSHKLALEQEKAALREKTLETIAEGQVRDGIVRRLTNYGAFVDLGGIDGLLHISEMSWTRINHPSDVVKVGDKIQVVVLKLNLGEGKISLGMRQILPDPWSEVEEHFSVGDIVPGRVTRLVPFGAFVQLETGIEGIVPNIELAEHRVTKPEQVVSVGDKVNVKILDVNPEERRMTLSLREAPQPEPKPKKPKAARKEPKAEPAAEGGAELSEGADVQAADTGQAESAPAEAAGEDDAAKTSSPEPSAESAPAEAAGKDDAAKTSSPEPTEGAEPGQESSAEPGPEPQKKPESSPELAEGAESGQESSAEAGPEAQKKEDLPAGIEDTTGD